LKVGHDNDGQVNGRILDRTGMVEGWR
jgi:hypothetical protein